MWTKDKKTAYRFLRKYISLLLALCLWLPFGTAGADTFTVNYPASEEVLYNPYTGNAVWASDADEHEQPFTLVYADLTWADFEPEQGVYDFASFENENQFDYWRSQGKHVILRFVLDVPGSRAHRDIPDWLYALTGDGTDYALSYGKGYSPNYANETLIRLHAAAIAALGEHYGDDPLIAYVQLGSLGHWGEWHLHQKLGLMPDKSIRDQYVLPYIDAFPNAFIMMRRPFAIAAEYELGLFNDTSGEVSSTETWLSWIQNGGDYEADGGAGALTPMPDIWQTAPIGGELSTFVAAEDLLGSLFAQTLSLFERSHTSWIGPGSFADITKDGRRQDALDIILRTIGYRLRVCCCEITDTIGSETLLTLYWTNDGIAPFYFGWQPSVLLVDEQGNETLIPLDIDLIDILPDTRISVTTTLPEQSAPYTLWVGIIDPSTGEPGVALSMITEQDGLWYKLGDVEN